MNGINEWDKYSNDSYLSIVVDEDNNKWFGSIDKPELLRIDVLDDAVGVPLTSVATIGAISEHLSFLAIIYCKFGNKNYVILPIDHSINSFTFRLWLTMKKLVEELFE